jgi:serine/threonine-protein kinase
MELKRFGKYEVLGPLGEGAMGVVYKAQDPILNRFVAIKTISAGLGTDDELRQRFLREARAAASLNHPNIITIHDFGEEQGQIYMAMELLEGDDLKDLIGTESPKPLEEKLEIMEQICDGLAFAHAKNIVHRDLKPGNIHIQPNGRVKILDFGLARLGGSDMTKAGVVMGTPNYMSPEQVMGERVDARSDIFSLGAVFYEIITNHKPFEADSVHAVLYQVVHKDPQPVREWDPSVPRAIVELVEKMLAKDPAQRFAHAGELRDAVRGIRQALAAGRLESATLAEVMEVELVDEAEVAAPPDAKALLDADGTLQMEVTPVPAPPPSAPRSVRPSRPTSLPPRRPPMPRAAPKTSRTPYLLGGLVVVGVLAAVGWLALRELPRPSTPTRSVEERVGALTQALVRTQLNYAKRVLEDKDYEDAAKQAREVLALDPTNREARELLQSARDTQATLDTAAAEARRAFEEGDTQDASEALSRVMSLDPGHPVAAELSAKLNEFFQAQATDARTAMERSRAAAETGNATDKADFGRAVSLAQEASGMLDRGEFAEATQGFLKSRDAFDRARRAEAAARAEAERAEAERAVAERALPAATPAIPSTPHPTPMPSATPRPATAPTTLAPAVPATLPARTFQAARTSIQGAQVEKGGLAGFDTSGVQRPPEFQGSLEFEASPPEVRPGETCVVKVFLANSGKKSVKLDRIEAQTYADGARLPVPVELQNHDSRPGKRVLVGELSVVVPAANGWTLEVTVTSEKGETYRSRLRVR